MAGSIKGFPKDFIWPRAASRDRPFAPPPAPIVPARSLQQDQLYCASWLLPPERPTGLEAVVQSFSKSAGVLLLLATVLGILWLAVG